MISPPPAGGRRAAIEAKYPAPVGGCPKRPVVVGGLTVMLRADLSLADLETCIAEIQADFEAARREA